MVNMLFLMEILQKILSILKEQPYSCLYCSLVTWENFQWQQERPGSPNPKIQDGISFISELATLLGHSWLQNIPSRAEVTMVSAGMEAFIHRKAWALDSTGGVVTGATENRGTFFQHPPSWPIFPLLSGQGKEAWLGGESGVFHAVGTEVHPWTCWGCFRCELEHAPCLVSSVSVLDILMMSHIFSLFFPLEFEPRKPGLVLLCPVSNSQSLLYMLQFWDMFFPIVFHFHASVWMFPIGYNQCKSEPCILRVKLAGNSS